MKANDSIAVCADCDRLLRELIAANEKSGTLLHRMVEAARMEGGEYKSLREQAGSAGIELNRARNQYVEHRKEHAWPARPRDRGASVHIR
jgi:hypothetical protein